MISTPIHHPRKRWIHPVALAFFSGHSEAMLVLESMRHDNRAEGVSVDFRCGAGRGFLWVGSCEVLEEFKEVFLLVLRCCPG